MGFPHEAQSVLYSLRYVSVQDGHIGDPLNSNSTPRTLTLRTCLVMPCAQVSLVMYAGRFGTIPKNQAHERAQHFII
jgi:hypothetical protein